MPQYLIAFGANQDSPARMISEAHLALAARGVRLCAVSRFFASPCFPVGAGPDYVNSVAVIETDLEARATLHLLHEIEAGFGRERTQRWGQRSLDIDLLAAGDVIAPDLARYRHWQELAPALQAELAPEELILPHPRIQDRAFVLVPLMDVAHGWRHPVLGQTVAEMLEKHPESDRNAVKPL